MLADYYRLCKPGIIYGNMLTAVAGFLLAARGDIDWTALGGLTVGLALVIAAACVSNNILDRRLDAKMKRTRTRALVSGRISPLQAVWFAGALLTTGSILLAVMTNLLALTVALAGYILYVVVYGAAKRASVYGTEAGSLSGAAPIVAGYVASSGQFDGGALLVFLVLVAWQMPHFYAIALYRSPDYKAAALPVLPNIKGEQLTKRRSIIYIIGLTFVITAMTVSSYTGVTFLLLMHAALAYWLYVAYRYRAMSGALWGRKMFTSSLTVLLAFSLLISADAWLI